MKSKIIFLVFIIGMMVSITGCKTSPQEQLMKDAKDFFNKEVLVNFKDPKSFEEISVSIKDTVFEYEYYNNVLELDSVLYKSVSTHDDRLNKLEANKIKLEMDSIVNLIKHSDHSKIKCIDFCFKYRAKNGFGAMDIGETTIWYNLIQKKFYINSVSENM